MQNLVCSEGYHTLGVGEVAGSIPAAPTLKALQINGLQGFFV